MAPMAHDSHDAHGQTPREDEPKSPLWLPALGAALFLVAGIWWFAFGTPEPKATSPDDAASAAASASAAPSASASAAPAQPAR